VQEHSRVLYFPIPLNRTSQLVAECVSRLSMPLGSIFGRRWLVWLLMRGPAFQLLWVNNTMYSHRLSQHEPIRKITLIFASLSSVYHSLTTTARLKERTVLDRDFRYSLGHSIPVHIILLPRILTKRLRNTRHARTTMERSSPPMYTHFNIENICLSNLLVYLRFKLEHICR
jgi:hypothetical protein